MWRKILLYLSSLALTAGIGLLAACNSAPSKPNVVLIVLDTTRADHLGTYGYERNTTPNLDRFAAENLRFEYAVTAAPWTPPSVASILTGLYAGSHGMMPPNSRELARQATARLHSALETVAEALKKSGYQTAGVSPNPWISEKFNFNQGFDDFRYRHRARADKINGEARALLANFETRQQPFFLYLHYLDPHDPYDPPPGYRDVFKGPLAERQFRHSDEMLRLIGSYDGELNFLDAELGKLFSHLDDQGLYDDTLIIVVGDHGEQFMEHGKHRHGFKLFNEEVHVPLMVHTGKRRDRGRVFPDTVSTVDIYPTILSAAGIEPPPGHPGISLLDFERLSRREGVYSEIRRHYDQRAFVSREGQKIIFSVDYDEDRPELAAAGRWNSPQLVGIYDRRKNYEEQESLDDPRLARRLKSFFGEMQTRLAAVKVAGEQEKAQLSDETLEQLKSLGYLQ